MARNRRTIKGSLLFEGVGIHSGAASSVRLSPLREGTGICFRFGEARYPISVARHGDSRRNMTIGFPGGETLQTVEHVLSALVGMEVDDVLIEVEGRELPILDGSALPFAEALHGAGFEESGVVADTPALAVPTGVDLGKSCIVALPSDETRVTYTIDYPGTAIGTEMKSVVLTPDTFLAEIAPARTFGLLSEVEALHQAGLGLGGDLNNVMIIGADGPLNTVGYRVDRECAAHKVLDLLGDLALAGPLMRAHYICICGGHSLHSKLVDRLKSLPEIRRR